MQHLSWLRSIRKQRIRGSEKYHLNQNQDNPLTLSKGQWRYPWACCLCSSGRAPAWLPPSPRLAATSPLSCWSGKASCSLDPVQCLQSRCWSNYLQVSHSDMNFYLFSASGCLWYIGLFKQQQHMLLIWIAWNRVKATFSMRSFNEELLTSCNKRVPFLSDPEHGRPPCIEARRKHKRLFIRIVDSTQSLDVMCKRSAAEI